MGRRRYSFCYRSWISLLLATASLILYGCDMPRDPEDTLEQVRRGKVVKAGAILGEPYAIASPAGDLQGIEIALIMQFAATLGATVEWTTGSEHALMESLKEHELDLVVGGLSASSAYEKEVGLTKPYHTAHIRLASSDTHSSAPGDAKDQVVRFDADRVAHQALIARKKGKPTPARRLPAATGQATLLAAEDWRLKGWGLATDGDSLHKLELVIAVAQGENQWMLQLEKFLGQQKDHVEGLFIETERNLEESTQRKPAP